MTKSKAAACLLVELTPKLSRRLDDAYREVLDYVRLKTDNSELQDLMAYPEYDQFTDALFLIRSGVLRCHYRDGILEDSPNDALLVEINI